MNPNVQRAMYFTSVVGDELALHNLMVTLRNFDLEPSIVRERSELAAHRQNLLNKQQIIEKPKGVDIALAVRMLEDTFHQAFDVCHLYTSDVDFLPLIQAVRARGKQVYVHGYKSGLRKRQRCSMYPTSFSISKRCFAMSAISFYQNDLFPRALYDAPNKPDDPAIRVEVRGQPN